MKALKIIAATFAALAINAFADKDDSEKSVPDVTVDKVQWTDVVNGVEFDSESVKGKVVVVEEWGVNCAPCIASLPDMAKLAKRYEKKGLVVVGMERQGGTVEEIEKLLKKARVKYPVMSGGSAGVASDGIPHAVVYDSEGKLVWHGHPADKEFEKAVKTALRGMPKA